MTIYQRRHGRVLMVQVQSRGEVTDFSTLGPAQDCTEGVSADRLVKHRYLSDALARHLPDRSNVSSGVDAV